MQCNHKPCGEVCSVSGLAAVDFDHEFDEEHGWTQVWVDYYQPKSISPAPHMFRVIKDWPAEVRGELAQAFALFWSDLDSCGNKFRAAVEALLTERGVPKYAQPIKGRRRTHLNLHTRIERFKTSDSEAAEVLMAIKWIGNHGSHGGEPLRREDILTAAELMEHALLKIYAPSNDAVRRAKAINKRRGPLKTPAPRTTRK